MYVGPCLASVAIPLVGTGVLDGQRPVGRRHASRRVPPLFSQFRFAKQCRRVIKAVPTGEGVGPEANAPGEEGAV